jgi:caffeoyl-CoA O-methyltransferase
MSPRSFLVPDALQAYLLAHSTAVDAVATSLIAQTQALGGVSGMQVAPEQGLLLGLLTRLVGAANVVEVGTFTGYSALCIARNLAPGGRLTCCDVSEEWTSIGRQHWELAGVADRIDLRIAPAAETLAALPADPVVDLCFLDADKGGYATYWDLLVPRVRQGGLLLVDNVLWSGRVVEDEAEDDAADTVALRAFNDKVAADDRVDVVLLPLFDGLTFAVKR